MCTVQCYIKQCVYFLICSFVLSCYIGCAVYSVDGKYSASSALHFTLMCSCNTFCSATNYST